MVTTHITAENEGKYQENTKHNHLTQPPNYENIKNIFRNIQVIQQYRFLFFLLCVGKIANKIQLQHRRKDHYLTQC